MAHGFLRRLFEVFERYRTAVDVVTTSEVSVSVTVDDTRRLDEIVEQPAAVRRGGVRAEDGDRLARSASGCSSDPALFARALGALGGIPLRLVSQAASRRNITFVMRDADVPAAMTRLHDAFF